jgi:hypothetical protein
VPAFALLGGIALYVVAHVGCGCTTHSVNRQRLLLAAVLVALWPLATVIAALATLAVINMLIWTMMVAYESSTYDDEVRYRLRHHLDLEPPTN